MEARKVLGIVIGLAMLLLVAWFALDSDPVTQQQAKQPGSAPVPLADKPKVQQSVATRSTVEQGSESDERKVIRTREQVDTMEDESIKNLFTSQPGIKRLFDSSFGHAVFDSVKNPVLDGESGTLGVAVNKQTGERTYMQSNGGFFDRTHAGSPGLMLFFPEQKLFDEFARYGIGLDVSQARENPGVGLALANGIIVYQLDDAETALSEVLGGTKFQPVAALNQLP